MRYINTNISDDYYLSKDIGRPSGASIGRTPTQHKQNEVGGQAKRSSEKKFPETTYPRINPTLQPLRDSFTLDLDQASSQSDDRSVGATKNTQLSRRTKQPSQNLLK
jgi:hypothetical protein